MNLFESKGNTGHTGAERRNGGAYEHVMVGRAPDLVSARDEGRALRQLPPGTRLELESRGILPMLRSALVGALGILTGFGVVMAALVLVP
jgi:hypothetical protein